MGTIMQKIKDVEDEVRQLMAANNNALFVTMVRNKIFMIVR